MIQIFTDAAANLSQQLLRENGIDLIPVLCTINGETLDQSVPFDGRAFYDRTGNHAAGKNVSG